ncbi:MAG: portal protein [Candidatus Bathyarchaeia archaeon]
MTNLVGKHLPDELIARYNAAKTTREYWRGFMDEAYKYIFPNRNNWDSIPATTEPEGKRKNPDVWDITAPLSARAFVGKMFSTLTPPFRRWASYVAGSAVPEASEKEVNEDLQKQTEILFKFIDQSNFALAITECYMDIIMGTAAVLIEEGDDEQPLIFTCLPTAVLAFEEDSQSVIQNTYREHHRLKMRDIVNKWPLAVIPEDRKIQSEADSEAEFSLLDCIIFDESKNIYTYYVVFLDDSKVIFQDESKSQRIIVFRWSKLPGEVWGRGIAHDAMPTIRSLNELIKLMYEASEIGAFPPMVSYDGAFFNTSNVNLSPKTFITVKGLPGQRPPIESIPFNPNLQFSEAIIGQSQEWVRRAFYDEPLGPVDAPKKTATEVSIRQQAFVEEIGAAFGRFEVEFLGRIIDRCTFILRKKGFLSKKIVIDGKSIDLKYRSPLAKLQDQEDLEATSLANQMLQQLMGEFAVLAYNFEKIPTFIAEKANADLTLFKSPKRLQRLAQDIMQRMLTQLEVQQQQTPAAAPAGPSPEPSGAAGQLIPTQPEGL